MHTLQAIVTGTVQGLSEFLPISSSAHIVFSQKLYVLLSGMNFESINKQEEIFFDISVHLATLFAVLIYFYKDLKEIFKDFFKSIKAKDFQNYNFKIVNYIALSTIITGIIGLLIKNKVEKLIDYPQVVCALLLITGILLLLSEKFYKGDKKVSLKSSIFIAIAQGLAIFPGFSRSGFTMATALLNGINRVHAAKYSFLMSIPVIFLASLIYPLFELDLSQISEFNIKAIIIGFITAFIVGYLCIKYFMKLLSKISLRCFGYYCITVSITLFILFQFFYHQ